MSAHTASAWRLLGATLEQRLGPNNPDALAAVRPFIAEKIALAATMEHQEVVARMA